MKKDCSRIVYLARIDRGILPGIYNKVKQTTEAFNEMGFDARLVTGEGVGSVINVWKPMWAIFFEIVRCRADILIVRIDIFMPLWALGLLWRRIGGCKIIAEVPTPVGNWVNEIKINEGSTKIRRIVKQLLVYLSFPWALYPAHKIIQYAPESRYFSYGLRKKTLLVANGIDVKNFPKRVNLPQPPEEKFVMIGVASFARWHGFDRVIRGIAEFLRKYPEGKVAPLFIIVGDGPIRSAWEKLCVDLQITSYVHFTGFKTGSDLDALFEKAHIAISSLGLYDVQLQMASTLKSREYTARGIPFVKTGGDIDFDPLPAFVYEVENNSSAVDVEKLIYWYEGLRYDQSISGLIRTYAKENLSFSVKAGKLVE